MICTPRCLVRGAIAALLIGFTPGALSAREDVSPSHLVEIHPAWCILQTGHDPHGDSQPFGFYKQHYQRHVLEVLNAHGIYAIPSLYTSAFQCGYDARDLADIDTLLAYELPCPYGALELIPVVREATIDYGEEEYSVTLALSIYVRQGKKLGKEIYSDEIRYSGDMAREGSEYERLKEAVDAYREFFTSPLVLSRRRGTKRPGKDYEPHCDFVGNVRRMAWGYL